MKTRDLDCIRFVTRHFNDLQGLRYWVPLGLITLSVGGTTYFANPPWVFLRVVLALGAVLLTFSARRYYRNAFGEVEPQPVAPAGELASLSTSPAGPAPRLSGFQQVRPRVRHSLAISGLAMVLFVVFQAMSPPIMFDEDESLVQPPWTTLSSVISSESPRTVPGVSMSPSTAKAVGGQLMYALYGSFFLGVWLWRDRRRSQGYHLALGVLLLGLAAFGTSLGYLMGNWEIVRIVDPFIPAVAHLWVALLLCGAAMVLAGLLDHWQLVRVLGRPALEEPS